jgi:hypothetical protein
MKTKNLSSVALLQALGVGIYVGLISLLLNYLERTFQTASGLLVPTFFLLLLVFSAAVCGSLIFGYPAYLAMNNKIKDALLDLLYTLLYCLGLIAVILMLLFI